MIDWGGLCGSRSIGAARGGGPLTSHHALPGRLDWLALGARPASPSLPHSMAATTCGEQCSASSGGGDVRDALATPGFTFYIVLFDGTRCSVVIGPPR